MAAGSCDRRLRDRALDGKRGGALGDPEERPEEEAMTTDSFFGGRVEERKKHTTKTWVEKNESRRDGFLDVCVCITAVG